jgi:hypothetical protein
MHVRNLKSVPGGHDGGAGRSMNGFQATYVSEVVCALMYRPRVWNMLKDDYNKSRCGG